MHFKTFDIDTKLDTKDIGAKLEYLRSFVLMCRQKKYGCIYIFKDKRFDL